jgi:predicted regulator of Ras-like GTPase activity (Roadblock/LC7/MglB family)
MEAAQALANLTEISAQIEAAVVFEHDGEVVASTLDDDDRAARVAQAARELLQAAEPVREGAELAQLEAAFPEGSVFVVRHDERAVAATTGPEPTVGLVFYDLKSCLREAAEPGEKPKPTKRAATRKRTTAKSSDESA